MPTSPRSSKSRASSCSARFRPIPRCWKRGCKSTTRATCASTVRSTMRAAAGLADALCAMLYAGEREWVLMLGERTGRLDRAVFEADVETLLDVFTQLLRQLVHGVEARSLVDHVTGLPDRWATMNRLPKPFRPLGGTARTRHCSSSTSTVSRASTIRSATRTATWCSRRSPARYAMRYARTNSSGASAVTNLPSFCRSCAAAKKRPRRQNAWPMRCAVWKSYTGRVQSRSASALHSIPSMRPTSMNGCTTPTLRCIRPNASVSRIACSIRESGLRIGPRPQPRSKTPIRVNFFYVFSRSSRSNPARSSRRRRCLRSLHPQDGVQSAFITMEAARARRSIEHLDAWVVRRALACAHEWRAQGVERIHVNIGQASDEILSNVLRAVDGSGCDTSMLALELEWTKFKADFEAYHNLSEAAERCGLYVGLDGFGETELDLPHARVTRRALRQAVAHATSFGRRPRQEHGSDCRAVARVWLGRHRDASGNGRRSGSNPRGGREIHAGFRRRAADDGYRLQPMDRKQPARRSDQLVAVCVLAAGADGHAAGARNRYRLDEKCGAAIVALSAFGTTIGGRWHAAPPNGATAIAAGAAATSRRHDRIPSTSGCARPTGSKSTISNKPMARTRC